MWAGLEVPREPPGVNAVRSFQRINRQPLTGNGKANRSPRVRARCLPAAAHPVWRVHRLRSGAGCQEPLATAVAQGAHLHSFPGPGSRQVRSRPWCRPAQRCWAEIASTEATRLLALPAPPSTSQIPWMSRLYDGMLAGSLCADNRDLCLSGHPACFQRMAMVRFLTGPHGAYPMTMGATWSDRDTVSHNHDRRIRTCRRMLLLLYSYYRSRAVALDADALQSTAALAARRARYPRRYVPMCRLHGEPGQQLDHARCDIRRPMSR